MSCDKFILDERGEPVPEPDLIKWAKWFERADNLRRVCNTHVPDDSGRTVTVSTVFLGLDHNFSRRGGPVLWETMVFGGPEEIDQTMTRCAGGREQAEAMHAEMVEKVKEALKCKSR